MDGTLRPLFPREGRLKTSTRDTLVRLTCPCERAFTARIRVTIDIDADPGALEELTDEGCQRVTCPRCDGKLDLAEPILFLNPERQRCALFVPAVLGHRTLSFQAELAAEIAGSDPSALPDWGFQPAVLVGVLALRSWLFGPGARSLAPAPQAEAPPPRPAAPPVVQHRPSAPPIHEAFADLVRAESRQPSTVPAAPEIDDVDEDEPMFGDEWLGRDTVPPAFPAGRPPAADEPGAPTPRAAPSGPPVDFPELLDEEDFEEEDEAGDDLGEVAIDPGEGASGDEDVADEPIDDGVLEEVVEPPSLAPDLLVDEEDADEPRAAPAPLRAGADRCAVAGDEGVILCHRVPAARIDLFDPSTADLWFQLIDVAGTPWMAITLVSDPALDRPHFLAWPIDPRRTADREIIHALRRSYRAELRLYDEELREAARFSLAADRELNVSVIVERAARVLAREPAADEELAAAATRLAAAAQPFGEPLPPLFTAYGLPPMEGFDQARTVLAQLADWLEPERHDHLVLVRSFPLDYLEEIVVEVVDRCVRLGVRLPERLKDRAVALGHAPDRAALCLALAGNFDALLAAGAGPAGEIAARNWRELLADCAEEDASWDPAVRDRAEELLEAHGMLDEATLREAQAALADPAGLETDQLLRMLQQRRLRAGAIAALCARAEPAAWKEAVRAVERLDANAILSAVRAVAGLREAVSGEITGLLVAERPHVRQAAAALLGALALRRTLMPVLKALGQEPTPLWTELARAVAATGSAAVRSIERQLTDEHYPLERLALAVRLLEQETPRAGARFEAMAASGDERATRLMALARSASIEPSRVAPAERYGELLRRAAAGEAVPPGEAATVAEAYRAALER
jgi:hypothetical protein